MEKKPLADVSFCVIDTETTGGSAVLNRVIDVAVLRFQGGEIVETFQSLINPGRPIPQWISNLTGITDSMVEDAPSFNEIAAPLQKILDQGVFTAHNANFDYRFVQEEFRRLGDDLDRPVCCTLKLARHLYPELPSRSLSGLCDHLLIDIWDRHRAYGDAEATVYALKNMIQKAQSDHGIESWPDMESFSKFGRLTLPHGIPIRQVAALPVGAGTYIFKDEKGGVVLKGQTKDIQRRIRTFFQSSNQSEKSNRLRTLVKQIEVLSLN